MEASGVKRKACARCRDQRTGCPPDCKYASYFPANEPKKYTVVHKVFGASNAVDKLQKLPVNQQEVALKCMVYEAEARLQDPVYGCSQVIWALEERVQELERLNSILTAEICKLREMTLLGEMLAAQVQMDQSQPNYRNDNAEPLEVMSEATAPPTATQARPA